MSEDESRIIRAQAIARRFLARRRGNRKSPFLPASDVMIAEFLQLANIGPSDVVCDFGCGDCRVLKRASALCTHCVGVELDDSLIGELPTNIDVVIGSFFDDSTLDEVFRHSPTVLWLYLLPEALKNLYPLIIARASRGTRTISGAFRIPGVTETQIIQSSSSSQMKLYLYIV